MKIINIALANQKKEAKKNNKLINKKSKCYGCIYNKRNIYWISKSENINLDLESCKYFKKI